MENTVEQMEIMALDTKIGTDTLDAVRKMIPEDRKLNLEKVGAEKQLGRQCTESGTCRTLYRLDGHRRNYGSDHEPGNKRTG